MYLANATVISQKKYSNADGSPLRAGLAPKKKQTPKNKK
jgi:hypothetical protein